MAKIIPTPMWNVPAEVRAAEVASVAPRQAVEDRIGDEIRRALRPYASGLPFAAAADLQIDTDDVPAETWISVFFESHPADVDIKARLDGLLNRGAAIYEEAERERGVT